MMLRLLRLCGVCSWLCAGRRGAELMLIENRCAMLERARRPM